MAFSAISSMITSIRYNASLRRSKRVKNKFSKKSDFSADGTSPLTREENLRIIEENKKILANNTRSNRLLGIIMILLYGSIIAYVVTLVF